MFTLDRQKYLGILESEGLSAAITALHNDTRDWEYETFEGHEGYKPELWAQVEEARGFSRELWDLAMKFDPK